MLDNGSYKYTIKTKLQFIDIGVNSVIRLSVKNFQDRIGSNTPDKVVVVESVSRNGNEVVLDVVDLSMVFNKCAKFTDSSGDFVGATELEKLTGGYFKDDEGFIDDIESYYNNLYW